MSDQPRPLVLTIPGLWNSGPDHWQSLWERERQDCRRVELGCWDDPIRNVWISRVDQAVHEARGDVVLVAHSLGCHAVAWWANLVGPAGVGRVKGALLVAPPDVDLPEVAPRLARFQPTPTTPLPFPALLVASRSDHYATFERAKAMADLWGALLVDVGDLGHINAASRLGSWEQGQHLLSILTGDIRSDCSRAVLAERIAAQTRGHGNGQPPIEPDQNGRSA
ncbi:MULTISPECIES: RBBP9/YdeN family alpha/beta hydrolase [Sphingomonas]|jgi:predicted alpha/beta hydrolase family esterase|uniref:RBBP9/YdeN family alpha/beta hydrolase n=2 Tax=Pseudomonadota TaxID=1224 RepID=UPI001AE4AC52